MSLVPLPAGLSSPLSPFEREFVRRCRKGDGIRIKGTTPNESEGGDERLQEDDRGRVLRSELLEWALTNHRIAERLTTHTIRLQDVIVRRDPAGRAPERASLILDRKDVLLMVRFKNVTFEQGISMRHARARDFSLVSCSLGTYQSRAGRYRPRTQNPRDRRATPLKNDVSLDAYGARFTGRLVFAAASQSSALAEGVVNLAKVVADGFINMRTAQLEGYPVSLDMGGLEARSVFLSRAFQAFGSVYAHACTVHDVFSAEAGKFGTHHDLEGPEADYADDDLPPQRIALNLRYADIGGLLQLTEGFQAHGTVDLKEARVRGPLDLWGAKFYMPRGVALLGHNLRVEGDLVCTRPPNLGMSWYDHKPVSDAATFHGEVTFANAQIGGEVDFARALVQAPPHSADRAAPIALSFYRARVGGRMRLGRGFRADGLVALEEARIDGSLDLQGGWFLNPRGLAIAANRIDVAGDVLVARKWTHGDLYSRVGEQDSAPVHPEDWPHFPPKAQEGDILAAWTTLDGFLDPAGSPLSLLLRRFAEAYLHPQRYEDPPLLYTAGSSAADLTCLQQRIEERKGARAFLEGRPEPEDALPEHATPERSTPERDKRRHLAALLWLFLKEHGIENDGWPQDPVDPLRTTTRGNASGGTVPDSMTPERQVGAAWVLPLKVLRLLERRFLALGMVSFKAATIHGDLDLSGGLYMAAEPLPPKANHAPRGVYPTGPVAWDHLENAIASRSRKQLSKWIALDLSHATVRHALYLTRWVPSSPATSTPLPRQEKESPQAATDSNEPNGDKPQNRVHKSDVYPIVVSGLIDLTASTAGQVHLDPAMFERAAIAEERTSTLLLEGFIYDAIFDEVSDLARCDWFYRGKGSTAQPNEQLAAALRRQGHHDESRRALLSNRSTATAARQAERLLLTAVSKLFPWQRSAFWLFVAFIVGSYMGMLALMTGRIDREEPSPPPRTVVMEHSATMPGGGLPEQTSTALALDTSRTATPSVQGTDVPAPSADVSASPPEEQTVGDTSATRAVDSVPDRTSAASPESEPRILAGPRYVAVHFVLGMRYAAGALLPVLAVPSGWTEIGGWANLMSFALSLIGLVLVSTLVVGVAGVFRKP